MIKLLFFAGLAERLSMREMQLEVSSTITVKMLKKEIIQRFPQIADLVEISMVSVNQEFAQEDQLVESGDEVALIPPVSGG